VSYRFGVSWWPSCLQLPAWTQQNGASLLCRRQELKHAALPTQTMAMVAACLCLRSLQRTCEAEDPTGLPAATPSSRLSRTDLLADGQWLVVSRLRTLLPSGGHAKRALDAAVNLCEGLPRLCFPSSSWLLTLLCTGVSNLREAIFRADTGLLRTISLTAGLKECANEPACSIPVFLLILPFFSRLSHDKQAASYLSRGVEALERYLVRIVVAELFLLTYTYSRSSCLFPPGRSPALHLALSKPGVHLYLR
jgi:hypothetical protein